MKKKDAILAELVNGNYTVESIVQKTEARPKRVVEIMNNQVLKRNIEGMMNEDETEFIPGKTTKASADRIKLTNKAQTLGIASITMLGVTIVYVLFHIFMPRDINGTDHFAWLMVGNTILGFIGFATFLLALVGLIESSKVNTTKVGKIGWILNIVTMSIVLACVIASVIFVIILFTTELL